MGEAVPLDPRRAFFAPQFQIKLKGQKLGREVIADVTDVTYTDDETNIDCFEFGLGDWDSVALRPKYSSPLDEQGQPYKIGNTPAPNFDPGAQVELSLWYQGEGDPQLMLKGEIVSLTPSFPAGGAPTCRVRALNACSLKLQRAEVKGQWTGTKMGIARQIAGQYDIGTIDIPTDVENGGKPTTDVMKDGTKAYEELQKRAADSGLVMWIEDDADAPAIHFEKPEASKPPVASLTWGKSLISFAPQLSLSKVVEKVVVQGSDPTQKGAAQAIEETVAWSDLDLDEDSLGPLGFAGVLKAVAGTKLTLSGAEVRSKEEARERALGALTRIASELVKASGTAIGMPELRVGRVVEILGLGPRFSGLYRLSQTTHTLGASGYTVAFQARKLVFK